MNEYQLLTNRLEKIKLVQKHCLDSMGIYSKSSNDHFYRKFCKATDIAYKILGRIVDCICDKENIGQKL